MRKLGVNITVGLIVVMLVFLSAPVTAATASSEDCLASVSWNGNAATPNMYYDDDPYTSDTRIDIFWDVETDDSLNITVMFYSVSTDMNNDVKFDWLIDCRIPDTVAYQNGAYFDIFSGQSHLAFNQSYTYNVQVNKWQPPSSPNDDTKTFNILVQNIDDPVEMCDIWVDYECTVTDTSDTPISAKQVGTWWWGDLI
ncbi:MAG: hypothetical protein GWN76_21345 [candidate division Zixibacteria bacterium]|nr:hypothetical protein [candidate division Zixibacteria bacterium]NIR66904.1 hypothetical protein [candidate division Zixibacteria bacterium]NIS48360.1 hypothetical protein [candidate division Zixibacteria bacterium]NIU16478.1 hypothetical protein [candidate division Zixibacteria bacterium]NIX58811.1 hypothetical protein [candidate division Zixibacteria bacterium]